MKKILILPISFVLFLVVSQSTSAQDAGVAYPIAELGNCSSLTECRQYCDEPVHKEACISYAQNKGFYNSEALESQKETILEKAKTELGCTTKDECETFCSLAVNIEKCSAFAKKNNLPGGKNEANSESTVFQKAKTELGCNSKESCKEVCSLDANKTKCSEFARSNNLGGGVKKVGPGGCSQEAECVEYCKNEANVRECTAFGFVLKKEIKGPGGCDSAQSCREYCAEHPEECREFDAKRPQETEKSIEEEEKVVEKREQKKENVQEKKTIFRIFDFIKPKREEERKEAKVETKTETRKEPTKVPTPTVTKTPENTSGSGSTETLYKNTLELDDRVEACIKEGCIWKQTYCNCQYRELEYTPTKTPTPSPTKPVSGSATYELQSDYYYSSYEETEASEIEHEEDESITIPTSYPTSYPASSQSIQGARTERGLFEFFKGFFD